MKEKSVSRHAFVNPRIPATVLLIFTGALLALLGSGLFAAAEKPQTPRTNSGIQFGQSYHNDVSPPLSELAALWQPTSPNEDEESREAALNPKLPLPLHI